MLEGNLSEFSLTDIFHLLALTQKSGALRVSSDAREGRVFFHEGAVSFAVSDTRRIQLGARLVHAGLVSEERLLEVLESHHQDGDASLAELLVADGVVDAQTLGVFVLEQIKDAVFNLMLLDEGSFVFDAGGEQAPTDEVRMPIEELVAESRSRLAEWDAVSHSIPDTRRVVVMNAHAPIEGTVAMTSEEWRLLTLVDGRRTVADIIDLTGQGEFATCRTLAGLIGRNLLDTAEDGRTGLDEMLRRRAALRRLEEEHLHPVGPPRRAEQAVQEPAEQRPVPGPSAAPEVDPVAVESTEVRVETPAAPEPEPVSQPEEAVAEPAVRPLVARASEQAVDRAQVARELASLGFDDEAPVAVRRADAAGKDLARDEDINKGLLLRLIDGVKGA